MTYTTPLFEDDMLVAFLNGECAARQELPGRLNDYLLRSVLKCARRSPPALTRRDLAEDVVQQFWLLLLRKHPSSFNPERVSSVKYLLGILRTAERDVYASFSPPGQRTRPQKDNWEQPCVKSLDARDAHQKAEGSSTCGELIPDPINDMEMIDAKVDVERFLALIRDTAPEPIPQAVELVYRRGLTITEAAEVVAINRSTLRVKIDLWVRPHRRVLAA